MRWHFSRVAVVFALLPALAPATTGIIQVKGVRSWSRPDLTRVIVETTGPIDFRSDRVHNPDRLYLDILHARPWIAQHRMASYPVNDKLLRRVRVAETTPGTTRIVFDFASAADYQITRLSLPDRLIVELRPLNVTPKPRVADPVPDRARPPAVLIHEHIAPPYVAAPPLDHHSFVYPLDPRKRLPPRQVAILENPPVFPGLSNPPGSPLTDSMTALPPIRPPARGKNASPKPAFAIRTEPVIPLRPPAPREIPETASLADNPSRSMTRALGLKINRVVIDAGHGGHDDGTIGPHGALEKDIVLDVALRLAPLIRERLGAEVVLTRSDDTFIPLPQRTRIANERRADLFLSIHANSSPAPEVAGTETFYLNFTNSPGALDVAARENAGSDKTVGELKDLIQSITLNDKIEESHTFAQDIQTAINVQSGLSNSAARNRGVKRAPFVVLIGASMPSVLAEIGFLSNSKDESNLGKAEYRQKVAEALYKGVAQYAQSLSHFDVPKQVAASINP